MQDMAVSKAESEAEANSRTQRYVDPVSGDMVQAHAVLAEAEGIARRHFWDVIVALVIVMLALVVPMSVFFAGISFLLSKR